MRVTTYTWDCSGLTLVGTALSPAAGPRDYDRNSVALPTVAVRGPFSSYPLDDRGWGPRYDTIDSRFVIAQSCAICFITTQHLIKGRKFTSWNCLILIVRKPDLKLLFLA